MIFRRLAAAGSETSFTWADPEFVGEKGLYLPLWAPPTGETAGFHRTGIEKALSAGLTFRPIEDTAADTLRWFATLDEARQKGVLPPGQREQEAAALEAWKSRS